MFWRNEYEAETIKAQMDEQWREYQRTGSVDAYAHFEYLRNRYERERSDGLNGVSVYIEYTDNGPKNWKKITSVEKIGDWC